jgi:hypothetical protein
MELHEVMRVFCFDIIASLIKTLYSPASATPTCVSASSPHRWTSASGKQSLAPRAALCSSQWL